MKIKKIKNIFVLMLVGVLVFMQVGSAFAQEEEPPEEDTCVNPIAGLFDAYYGADTGEGQAAGGLGIRRLLCGWQHIANRRRTAG